jgi:ABC-type multidrug transport system fused ATPase/permease subunit
VNIFQFIRLLLPFVRPYRLNVIIALVLTAIGALIAQVNPVVLKYAVDEVQKMLDNGQGIEEGTKALIWMSVILLGKEFINLFVQIYQKFLGEKIQFSLSKDLYSFTINRILSYKLDFYALQENQTGRLEKRIDRGIESITRTVKNLFIDLLPQLANAVFALVLIFNANVYIGIVAFVTMIVSFWLAIEHSNRQKSLRKAIQAAKEEKTNSLYGMLESIFVVKSFDRENFEATKQEARNHDLNEKEIKHRRSNYWFNGIKSFVEQLGVVIVIIMTIWFVLTGKMSIGAIMFHVLLFNNVTSPVRLLHRIYDEFTEALAYAGGFFEMVYNDNHLQQKGEISSKAIKGNFITENVSFSYPNGKEALRNVNVTIQPGKTTAIVGLSGAGKTSLMNLLAGFYAPTAGKILLEGHSLQAYQSAYLRDEIGIVLQKNHIFQGSVEENIRYGKLDATVQEIKDAAEKASLHEQIMMFPKQYQSDAKALSGGQQQRIAIARLFLKDPPIIFLDEPTASLDAITTEQIKGSIEAIKRNRTVVIISHNISHIIDADWIYVMQDGEVIAAGTHEDLYATGGLYQEIIDSNARTLNIEKLAKTVRTGKQMPFT